MNHYESERLERDSLGEISVPQAAYYGPQTARALRNFNISTTKLHDFPELIRSLGYVKKAAVRANHRLNLIDDEKARAIEMACDELIAGHYQDEFPVDVFQGGAGTSANMNANEVIANLALAHLGQEKGNYDVIHPNNHVNLSQSTNDVYPSAVRLAILGSYEALVGALTQLAEAFDDKANEFASIVKLGRTQLQDAVPMTLGQEFAAFASTLREEIERLHETSRVFHQVNLGGTAIGTGINAAAAYQHHAVTEMAELTGISFQPVNDLIEASWDTSDFVEFSGILKKLATKISKICNDLRLLSSGPRGGFNEIDLPAVQPGSSIMPGKVNPVIPEAVNQVAFQVIGTDVTVTMASEAGQLQLNVMEPVICFNILNNVDLLKNAVSMLREHCVTGIIANDNHCARHLDASAALATALVPYLGYERAGEIAQEVLATGKRVRDLLPEQEDIPQALLEQLDNPIYLTQMR